MSVMSVTTGIRVVVLIFVAIGCLELFSLIAIVLTRPPEYAAMPIAWQFGRYSRMAILAALPLFGGIGFLRMRNAGRVALIAYGLMARLRSMLGRLHMGMRALKIPVGTHGFSAWCLSTQPQFRSCSF
jgi:energy-converting hydrogenase Eha subunit H